MGWGKEELYMCLEINPEFMTKVVSLSISSFFSIWLKNNSWEVAIRRKEMCWKTDQRANIKFLEKLYISLQVIQILSRDSGIYLQSGLPVLMF